jgi:hypothetical protein
LKPELKNHKAGKKFPAFSIFIHSKFTEAGLVKKFDDPSRFIDLS